MCVKRLCRFPLQKKVHFVIGFAYVKYYENGGKLYMFLLEVSSAFTWSNQNLAIIYSF